MRLLLLGSRHLFDLIFAQIVKETFKQDECLKGSVEFTQMETHKTLRQSCRSPAKQK